MIHSGNFWKAEKLWSDQQMNEEINKQIDKYIDEWINE